VKFAAPIFAELGFCEEKARVNSEMICSTKVFSRKHWNGFDDTIKSRFLHFCSVVLPHLPPGGNIRVPVREY